MHAIAQILFTRVVKVVARLWSKQHISHLVQYCHTVGGSYEP